MKKFKDENRLVVVATETIEEQFILQYAKDHDAAVISNNDFRNLCYGLCVLYICLIFNENLSNKIVLPEFEFIVKNRVIGFAFFKNMFIIPEDPYGRRGPFLNEILNKI